MKKQFPKSDREREREQEKVFWLWWQKIEPNQTQYTLRMAFNAGYEAAMKEIGEV